MYSIAYTVHNCIVIPSVLHYKCIMVKMCSCIHVYCVILKVSVLKLIFIMLFKLVYVAN